MSGAVNESAVSTGMPLAGEKATSLSLFSFTLPLLLLLPHHALLLECFPL